MSELEEATAKKQELMEERFYLEVDRKAIQNLFKMQEIAEKEATKATSKLGEWLSSADIPALAKSQVADMLGNLIGTAAQDFNARDDKNNQELMNVHDLIARLENRVELSAIVDKTQSNLSTKVRKTL